MLYVTIHTVLFFYSICKSPNQTPDLKENGQPTLWLQMATLISLRALCGRMWVNILTLSPQEGIDIEHILITQTQ